MAYATEQITHSLKAARESKRLSQRSLARLAGVPQSHISKIENGAVDLRLSSLVEIARALDLEVTLVPRKNLSAVQSIIRSSERPAQKGVPGPSPAREFSRLKDSLRTALSAHPSIKELAQLQSYVCDLQRISPPMIDLNMLREATKSVQAFSADAERLDDLRRSLNELQRLRNAIAHQTPQAFETRRRAYSLEDDDHG